MSDKQHITMTKMTNTGMNKCMSRQFVFNLVEVNGSRPKRREFPCKSDQCICINPHMYSVGTHYLGLSLTQASLEM